MAKKKKTSRKTSKTASRRKTTTRSKPAAKPAKKSPTKKKTAARSAGSSKKKTASKKTASKKKLSRSAASSKKSSGQKTTVKKKTTTKKKTADSKSSSKTTTKKTAAGSRKTTKKKSGGSASGNNRGFSVAEAAALAEADSKGYVFINGRRVRMISSKPSNTTKKVTRKKKTNAAEGVVADKPKVVKTKLSRKELNYYRKLLLDKRRELLGDLDTIEQEALRKSNDSTHMPIHMADIGSDTYEQDFMLGLAENERKQLREIDEALLRIKNNTYGMCLMTGKQIPAARLEAKPWAKYTIEAARQVEGSYGH